MALNDDNHQIDHNYYSPSKRSIKYDGIFVWVAFTVQTHNSLIHLYFGHCSVEMKRSKIMLFVENLSIQVHSEVDQVHGLIITHNFAQLIA